MDNLRYSDSDVAPGYGYFVHHGWFDPYSARNRDYNNSGKRDSGKKSPVGQ